MKKIKRIKHGLNNISGHCKICLIKCCYTNQLSIKYKNCKFRNFNTILL